MPAWYSKYTLYLSKIFFFFFLVCTTTSVAHVYVHISVLGNDTRIYMLFVLVYIRNGSNRVRIYCHKRRKRYILRKT